MTLRARLPPPPFPPSGFNSLPHLLGARPPHRPPKGPQRSRASIRSMFDKTRFQKRPHGGKGAPPWAWSLWALCGPYWALCGLGPYGPSGPTSVTRTPVCPRTPSPWSPEKCEVAQLVLYPCPCQCYLSMPMSVSMPVSVSIPL